MNRATVLVGLFCLSIGLALGYFLIPIAETTSSEISDADREPLFYRNAMNPQVTSPVPAKDSMGMDYVAVYAEDSTAGVPGTVKIDPTVQHNIGLRTAIANEETLSRTIRTVGRVDYDEEKIVRLHPKIEGWIKQIFVDKTGEFVAKNQPLLEIYSPKLVSSQQEYLLALRNFDTLKDSQFDDIRQGAGSLLSSSRDRLSLFDVPEHQINALEDTGVVLESLHIHSPAPGTVLNIGARAGEYVTPGTELYQIVDLSTVWVYADIYEYEVPWVEEGDPVEMTLASVPGRSFTGTVSYIYPYAEAHTRTTKVRIVFENTDLLLRPDMFTEVTINSQDMATMVVVPAESVIRSGDYDQIFVMTEAGVFEPRRVILGIDTGGKVAVLDGILPGESVVVSAQFLIDSESSLREATAKMTQLEQHPVSEDGSGSGMSDNPEPMSETIQASPHGSHTDTDESDR
jgi:Cu(I)/Ag(I) efflux system membrane fusion protein